MSATGMLVYILLTAFISYINATSVGRYWTEKKSLPGFTRLVLWSGAIMAYIGFVIVILLTLMLVLFEFGVIEAVVRSSIQSSLEPGQAVDPIRLQMEVEEIISAIFNLAYLGIIGPALASGFVITVNSWIVFADRRDLLSGGIAGYNTYAQVHNFVNAVQYVPSAGKEVADLFSGIFKNKDSAKAALILIPLLISFGSAYFITATIIRSADAKYVLGGKTRKDREDYDAYYDRDSYSPR